MDVGQKFNYTYIIRTNFLVSILVLMDVGQKLSAYRWMFRPVRSFNPCFNGCRSEIRAEKKVMKKRKPSFNPCFNGCRSEITFLLYRIGKRVSILVLMDVGQKCYLPHFLTRDYSVSILVLMDVGQKYYIFKITHISNPRFNPCFNGCRSEITSSS